MRTAEFSQFFNFLLKPVQPLVMLHAMGPLAFVVTIDALHRVNKISKIRVLMDRVRVMKSLEAPLMGSLLVCPGSKRNRKE